jgi:2,4-dienoyl-CoA reductase-like NADH-dependent reductase (Old Yellow Enzyme family)/thioredoxin reductase
MGMKVFEPIEIRGMKLKNRIAFAPLLYMPITEDGGVGEKTIRWFEERAKGGAGFIMTGSVNPTASPWVFPVRGRTGLSLNDDKYIPGFAKLSEAVHLHGAKIGIQITVLGPLGGIGMSPLPYPDEKHPKDRLSDVFGKPLPIKVISVEEIEQFEEEIAATAARAKKAGIDCVELHCAHGGATIHCASISPFYNRRTDQYGGDWNKRLRFPVETIQRIRKAVGENYPIIVRIDADELLGKRGITLEDTIKLIVPALENAGVDCFDVSQGSVIHSPEGITIPLYYPRGCFIHYAAAVKKATELPVIGVGRILDVEMAEKFLQEGKADIIYMGRQLTSDPETPKKYLEGRPEDIRKCIGCLPGACGRPCVVNYDIQDEPIPLTPAKKPKKALIIGGGIGGMEAARIATLRGHKVTIMEKQAELGGMVAALALTPLTAEFKNIVDYLSNQLRKLKVDVRICKEATVEDALNYDVALIATGSSLILPDEVKAIPGVMDHIEALKRKREIGKRVVIWGLVATELAISLAAEGKDVVLIGRGGEETLARDLTERRKFWTLRKLTDLNFIRETPEAERISNPKVMYYVEVEEVTPEGIRVRNKEGEKNVLPYDTIIISRERKSNDTLFNNLKGRIPEVYNIGDSQKVGDIKEAIWSANEIARTI